MEEANKIKQENKSIMAGVAIFGLVVAALCIAGLLLIKPADESVQGQIEGTSVRVSGKLPGRLTEVFVEEGEMVHAGDTLAHIHSSLADAKLQQAQSMETAASAQSQKAEGGTRVEIINTAYNLWQQALAAQQISKKTYDRMQNLYNEGVISGQKRDEAFAAYKATEAQVAAARSQYEMAKNGAREQEKRMAANNTQASKSAVDVVKNLLKETVQVAQCEGEVSNVYPKVGELVGLGSPIMSISIMSDMWGTFNVREDHLQGLNKGDEFTAFVPAFNKEIKMKVYYLKDQGSYATWKATKDNGDYDRKTFEVKARPITKLEGLRPGMSLIIK